MAQATSQPGDNANRNNPELSNIDYSRMCEQLRSLQHSNKVPEEYREALNQAVAVLQIGEIEKAFRQTIQPRRGQKSQTQAASVGQAGSSTVNTGETSSSPRDPRTESKG